MLSTLPNNQKTPISKSEISLPIAPPDQVLKMATEPLPRTSFSHNAGHHHPLPAIAPFSAGRFDSSASVAGGPSDPKILRQQMEPSKLTMRGYQTFAQALGSYRRQIQAMAAASEAFVRALEDISEFVPGADIRKPHIIGDLDFLIDSTHLVSNAHQIWADSLERDFEEPLIRHMNDIMIKTKNVQKENKQKIDDLVERLHKEEESSYKMGKKKQRDLVTLQNSLNVRVSLADDIKRLTLESQNIQDTLAANSVESILTNCAAGVRAELETYDRVMEGLKKLGAFATDADSQPYQTSRQTRYSMYSSTEILPNDSISNVMPNHQHLPSPPHKHLPMPGPGSPQHLTHQGHHMHRNHPQHAPPPPPAHQQLYGDGDKGLVTAALDDIDMQIVRTALNNL
ncbi:hypothetical protein HDU67_009918 [Dinochytrium kinnereticum]|nr:hypothetical protein HDU67_009918 [Dinochytrium kinnereticum]